MTINPALFPLGAQGRSDGGAGQPAEASGDAFARILAGLDPQLEADALQAAPAIPRIGSHGHAFAERPVLLDTPAALASGGMSQADPESAVLAMDARPIIAAEGNGPADLLRHVRQIIRAVAGEMPQPELDQPGFPGFLDRPTMIQNRLQQDRVLLPATGRAVLRTAPTLPVTASPATAMPQSRTASAAILGGGSATPTSRPEATARATPQAYSALLLQGADGMQLVIRLPDIDPEVRLQLEDRIARLFARRGLPVPATTITGPAAGAYERTA